MLLEPLVLPATPVAAQRRRELSALLTSGAAYLPIPDTDSPESISLLRHLGSGEEIEDGYSLVIATSGSTGVPKGALHSPATLRASATATAHALGGDGSWLLALPPHHIAGLQVLLRSLAAGFAPAVLDVSDGFHPGQLPAAIDAMSGPRRYTSLVPLQLRKALEHPSAARALAELDAVLVGGAATSPELLDRAGDAGIRVVRTYGMSETAGGCVYDGLPLPGVSVRIADASPDGVGRVQLGGPMIAGGYRHRPGHPAFATPGWFRTDDLGRLDDGVLSLVGRADEAISTGGLTVLPQVVEAVVAELPGVRDCVVVGLPDERLGERVVLVVTGDDPPSLDRVRGVVTERLGRYAAPREVIVTGELPLRGPGKVDRRAVRAQLARPGDGAATR